MVEDIDSYNGRLIGNHVWPIEWYDCQIADVDGPRMR